MKKLLITCLTIITLASLAACGVNQDSLYGHRNDQDGMQFVRNGQDEMHNEDSAQEDRKNTNQNPNFLNLSDTQPTLGTDVDKAREVIETYTDYEADEVWINGDQMWVTAHTTENLQGKKLNKAEADLKDRLVRALPRYRMNVQIKER